jgi:lipid II:glycine glycyltransferase (peptidoglycan interpeptide bridge formation enzyme)
MSTLKFEESQPKNWDKSIEEVFCSSSFAEAAKSEGKVFYVYNEKNKAIVVIKKKILKMTARAQIFTSSEDKMFLLEIIERLRKMKIPYARIGNTMSGLNKKIDLPNSKLIERNTFILDISKSKEDLWKNFDKKLRNVIRKAEKEKIIISEIENLKDLRDYYGLSLKTEGYIKKKKGRKTFSIQSFEFFEGIFRGGKGRFFIAKHEEKIIAGALFLIFGEKSIYFQSFLSREHSDKQAPSLIQWEAIKRLKIGGIRDYDLGGITLNLDKTDSRYFIYEFKRKFNGDLKTFYNFEFELSKLKKIQDIMIKFIYGK